MLRFMSLEQFIYNRNRQQHSNIFFSLIQFIIISKLKSITLSRFWFLQLKNMFTVELKENVACYYLFEI